jgi:O-antigen/teichoic acid export membrane protein
LLVSFLDKYSALAITIAANLALARILTPYDIGVYSIAASLVGVASALRDFGIASYLVQEKELTVLQQRTAIGVAVIITWTLGGLLAGFSAVIADYYGNPGVRDVILVLSINFFFIPFTMVVINVLRREMRFGALYRINLIAAIFRSATALAFALWGLGFMAMAWSSVAGVCATFVVTQFELPSTARLMPSLREWRHIASFGAYSTLGQILTQIRVAAPDMVIGRVLFPAAVGLYSRAFGMASLFSQAILEGMSPVALSAIAMRHRDGGNIRDLWLRGITHISAFGWPFFSFVTILTFPVMRILFGDQWDAAVPVARLICIAAMIGLIDSMTWATLQGTGSVGKYALLQLFTVPTEIAVMIGALAYEHDIIAAGWTAIFGSMLHVSASLYFLNRLADIRLRDVAEAVGKSAALAVLTSIAPALVTLFMQIGPGHLWLPVLIAGGGSGISFILGILVLRHPIADEVRGALTHAQQLVGWPSNPASKRGSTQ